jgi:HK97 family phage prohead protease
MKMTTTEATKARRASEGVLERRVRPFGETDAQIVRADDAAEPKFTGHAAVFNSRTAIGNPLKWGWYEEVATGAFAKTLAEGDARFLVDHESHMLVARVSAGDLRLAEDEVGLGVDADLDVELSYVKDLVRNLDKKRITGMSFGFYVMRDRWETETVELSDGTSCDVEVRYILEVRLLEVSAVTFPAYDDTDAGLRALCEEIRSARTTNTDLSPARGDGSAPSEEDTRSDQSAPSEEDTRALAELMARHTDLAAVHRPTTF